MKYLLLAKKWLIRVVVIVGLVWFVVVNWSFLFKKKVVGEVVAVEKVAAPIAIMASGQPGGVDPQIFSFSVAVKDRFSGEIFMASSEDRQWAAVTKGNCVVSAYFPYPPWKFSKGNTSHNARLLRNFTNCDQIPKDRDSSWLESIKFFFLLD